MKHHTAILAALAVVLAATPATAHEYFQVVGTVVARNVDKNKSVTIDIKTNDGGSVTLYLVKPTQVTRNGTKVPESEIKVGVKVDIESFGDTYDYADAMRVQLLPK